MYDNFCLDCEYNWYGDYTEHCPNCESENVDRQNFFEDGFFEGDIVTPGEEK